MTEDQTPAPESADAAPMCDACAGIQQNWRRVRDVEGTEGWVYHSRLSSRRTALVAPWSKEPTLPLQAGDNDGSGVVARLQPSVLATVEGCNGRWCRISGEGYRGWMKQDQLWGVYPGEAVK